MTRTELQALVTQVQAEHPEVELTLRPGLTDRDGFFPRKHYRVDIVLRVVHDLYVQPDGSSTSEEVRDFLDQEIDTLKELCSEKTREEIRVERMMQKSRERAAAERRADATAHGSSRQSCRPSLSVVPAARTDTREASPGDLLEDFEPKLLS